MKISFKVGYALTAYSFCIAYIVFYFTDTYVFTKHSLLYHLHLSGEFFVHFYEGREF